MATNLALDDKLIEEARRSGGHRTKKEAVTAALSEYVRRRKQLRILEAFGTFDFDPAYNYKAEQRKKRSWWYWWTHPYGRWSCDESMEAPFRETP